MASETVRDANAAIPDGQSNAISNIDGKRMGG